MDVHARIQHFLQQQTIVSLVPDAARQGPDFYLKAGVVPFLRQEPCRFYLMKPVARHADLAAPAFQLCKGTRMHCDAGGWQDMREGEQETQHKETLVATALREGIEELGLKMEAIGRLYDVGPYEFSSAKSGKTRKMWLFAAEMLADADFLPAAEVASATAERGWLTTGEFAIVGREDHRYILKDIESRLRAYQE